jgi:hypothetical protein
MRGFSLAVCAALTSLGMLSMSGAVQAGHCHHACRKCVICCCQQSPPAESRSAEKDEPSKSRSASRAVTTAPIVQSMPVYAMPAMFATMPVMPAMATSRSAERSATTDCCDRVDKLEDEMIKLARAVRNLQIVVEGQTAVLEKLAAPPAPATAAPAVVVP